MDVDFMNNTFEESSMTVIVDSELRDIYTYPHPNSYSISFEQPIKEVVGIEILDAAMPVTQYSIESDNNIIAKGIVIPGIGYSISDIYKAIEEYLQYNKDFQNVFEAGINGNVLVYLDTFPQYNDSDVVNMGTNLLLMYNTYDVSRSKSGNYQYILNTDKVWINNEDIANKINNDEIEYKISLTKLQLYVHHDSKYVSDAFANSLASTIRNTNGIDFMISTIVKVITPGNYNSVTLLDHLGNNVSYIPSIVQEVLPSASILLSWYDEEIADGETSKTQKYKWTMNTGINAGFFFDMSKSTMRNILGFPEINQNPVFRYKQNIRIFTSSLDSVDSATVQKIVSNGLIVFQGTKYLVLRCPEIESHILGSYSTLKQSPGIAMIKLTTTNSIAHLRMDFTNIIRKPFHPIGKLSRLTFSFYDKYGNLYDFKGLDHNFLLAIKFMVPKKEARRAVSLINPQYDPDILRYTMKQNGREEDNRNALKKKYTKEEVIREHQKWIPK
jgi:hypothetical protein